MIKSCTNELFLRDCQWAQHYACSFTLFSSHPTLPPKYPADVRIPAENRKHILRLMLGLKWLKVQFHPQYGKKKPPTVSQMPGEAIHRVRLDGHPSSSMRFSCLMIRTEHLCILFIYLYIHVCVHTYTYGCMYSPDHISLKNYFAQKGELMINECLLQLSSLLPPY